VRRSPTGCSAGPRDLHQVAEDTKVAHEHLYWDQASVLVQVGLLEKKLPVRGGEIAAQVQNPTQPMKELIRRASNENR
jgi:carboxymethylenebutenolidase